MISSLHCNHHIHEVAYSTRAMDGYFASTQQSRCVTGRLESCMTNHHPGYLLIHTVINLTHIQVRCLDIQKS
ncbi:hypothetical protein EMCRGX_G013934 [Ephydatia muelleri]